MKVNWQFHGFMAIRFVKKMQRQMSVMLATPSYSVRLELTCCILSCEGSTLSSCIIPLIIFFWLEQNFSCPESFFWKVISKKYKTANRIDIIATLMGQPKRFLAEEKENLNDYKQFLLCPSWGLEWYSPYAEQPPSIWTLNFSRHSSKKEIIVTIFLEFRWIT